MYFIKSKVVRQDLTTKELSFENYAILFMDLKLNIMELSADRMASIIACMYGVKAEVVVNYGIDECYLFHGLENKPLQIFYEEVDCLVINGIIGIDCGCDEPGHETVVYRLTDDALQKIHEIVKNKRKIQLLLE